MKENKTWELINSQSTGGTNYIQICTCNDICPIHNIQKLSEQRQSILEEVEKLKISKTVCDPGGKIGNPYNQALDTVISIIKEK